MLAIIAQSLRLLELEAEVRSYNSSAKCRQCWIPHTENSKENGRLLVLEIFAAGFGRKSGCEISRGYRVASKRRVLLCTLLGATSSDTGCAYALC
jgi:hypothetical protein